MSKKTLTEILTVGEKLDFISTHGINLDNKLIYMCGDIELNQGMILRQKYDMIKTYWDHFSRENKLTKKEKKEIFNTITIILNSFGGEACAILSVLDFYDYILQVDNIKTNILADTNCYSAATWMVAGATGTRGATKRCRFMVHEIQITGIGGTLTQAKSTQQEIERQQEELYELYATLTNKNKKLSSSELEKQIKYWKELCFKETYLSSTEALKLGLIDFYI